jgi:hypothetical protein
MTIVSGLLTALFGFIVIRGIQKQRVWKHHGGVYELGESPVQYWLEIYMWNFGAVMVFFLFLKSGLAFITGEF